MNQKIIRSVILFTSHSGVMHFCGTNAEKYLPTRTYIPGELKRRNEKKKKIEKELGRIWMWICGYKCECEWLRQVCTYNTNGELLLCNICL